MGWFDAGDLLTSLK